VLTKPGDNHSPETLTRLFVRRLSYCGGPLLVEAVTRHLSVIRRAIAGELDFRTVEPAEARKMACLALLAMVPLPAGETLKLAEVAFEKPPQDEDPCATVFAREVDVRLDEALAEALRHAAPDGPFSETGIYAKQVG
jgi:hypothetical protein